MEKNRRPINSIAFLNELPAFYSRGLGENNQLFRRFIMQFEEVFDELEAAIVGDALTLTYKGPGILKDATVDDEEIIGYPLVVDLFDAGRIGYPRNSTVFIPDTTYSTLLAEPIHADEENVSVIYVSNGLFSKNLKPGDKFVIRTSSGITGLTSIREMPPTSFRNLGGAGRFEYLQYLASWVGLPLRADKSIRWNRRFLREAVALDDNPKTQRSTLTGLTALLKIWHNQETESKKTIVSDLISPVNGVKTVFRIGECRIGISTLLGEGVANFFHVHLTADTDDVSMRNPKKIGAMTAAAKLIIDLEKPVHTDYALHIHAHTMRIAPDTRVAPYKNSKKLTISEDIDEDELSVRDTNTFARIGVTTLLWEPETETHK